MYMQYTQCRKKHMYTRRIYSLVNVGHTKNWMDKQKTVGDRVRGGDNLYF